MSSWIMSAEVRGISWICFQNSMPQNKVDDTDWANRPATENPWVIIETGTGVDEVVEFYYEISYNKITEERREEKCYEVVFGEY